MDFHLIHNGDVHWVQQKTMQKSFELLTGERVIGTLQFHHALSTRAEVQTSFQCWSFKRTGFPKTRISIRKSNGEQDFAIFSPYLFGNGVLQIENGHSFNWAPLNFWRTQWMFYEAGDLPILQFLSGSRKSKLSDLFKTQAEVEIMDASISNEQLCLLVPLGFYLFVLHSNDTAIAAAAGAS